MIEIYKASVENVRELKKKRKELKRIINKSIKDNSIRSVEDLLTKTYALMYSAFAETCFLKTIHTPYGFTNDLINQINYSSPERARNLEDKWRKCIELSFMAIQSMASSGEIQNKKKQLLKHVDEFIIQPSLIRNKIAHGQWFTSLNSTNTATNPLTTIKIKNLDFVEIDILFEIYEKISQVMEDLIESPHKTHFRDFYLHLTELDILVIKTKDWSIESKKGILKKKLESQKGIV